MKRIISFMLIIIVLISCNSIVCAEYSEIRKGESGQHVVELQKKLVEYGYGTNGIDGNFGGGTESAIRAFQSDNGLFVTGTADTVTLSLLFEGNGKKFGDVTSLDHLKAYAADYQDTYTIYIFDTENQFLKRFVPTSDQIVTGIFSIQDDFHYALNYQYYYGSTSEVITFDSDDSFLSSEGETFYRVSIEEACAEFAKLKPINNPSILEIIRPYISGEKSYSSLSKISLNSNKSVIPYSDSTGVLTQSLIPYIADTDETVNRAFTYSNKQDYVLNLNTHKFHYPNCRSVKQMNPGNRWDYYGTRDEIIEMGYVPCKNCNP